MLAAILLPGLGILMVSTGFGHWLAELSVLPAWTALLYCLIAGLLVGVALTPSHLTSLLAGYLYGIWLGGFTALAVVTLGTAVGFLLARQLAHDRLRDLVERSRWGRRLAAEILDDTHPLRETVAIAFARLPPQVPFALGNVVGASARAGLIPMLAGTMLGMLPRVVLVVWVGAALGEWEPGAPLPAGLAWAVGLALVGFGALFLWSGWILTRSSKRESASAS